MTESGDIFIWLPSVHSTGYPDPEFQAEYRSGSWVLMQFIFSIKNYNLLIHRPP
jgi:hypothetical protein